MIAPAAVLAGLAFWNLRGFLAFVALGSAFDLVAAAHALPIAAALLLFVRLLRERRAGAAGGILAFALLDALLVALAPPTEWDVLAYHLALPKLYLAAGKIYEVPWLIHSHWPHLMEALYAPLLAVDERAPALLHAGLCAAWAAAVFATARRRLGERAAWLTAALCASQPVVLRLAGTAHVDGAVALFLWLCCAELWSWTEDSREKRLVAAGLFAGLACSCKLLALVPAATLASWVLLRRPRAPDGRGFALFAAPAALLAAPWLLKSWLWAGDPVWPFFPGVFGGAWGGPGLNARYMRAMVPASLFDSLILRAPPLAGLAVSGAAALVASGRKHKTPAWLFLPGAVSLAAFARNADVWRFLWPTFPPLALMCAEVFAPWLDERGIKKAAAAAALALGMSAAAAAPCGNAAFGALAPRPSSGAADRRAAYLSHALDHFDFYRGVDAALAGKPARVLLFREIRGYYLNVPYLWGDPVNQGLVVYEELPDADALLRRLRELSITHVLVNEGLGIYAPKDGYYDARTLSLMGSVLARSRVVLRRGALALYELPLVESK